PDRKRACSFTAFGMAKACAYSPSSGDRVCYILVSPTGGSGIVKLVDVLILLAHVENMGARVAGVCESCQSTQEVYLVTGAGPLCQIQELPVINIIQLAYFLVIVGVVNMLAATGDGGAIKVCRQGTRFST